MKHGEVVSKAGGIGLYHIMQQLIGRFKEDQRQRQTSQMATVPQTTVWCTIWLDMAALCSVPWWQACDDGHSSCLVAEGTPRPEPGHKPRGGL